MHQFIAKEVLVGLCAGAVVHDTMNKDDISPEEVVEVGIGNSEHDDESQCTSTFAQRYKKFISIAVSFVAVVLVATAVSMRRYANDIDKDDDVDVLIGTAAMDINQSTFQTSTNKCQQNEGLWNLILTTDNYPYETSWALHDSDNNNNILAFGPPQGRKYEKQTRYIGTLCIPHGKYFMRWYDIMGDGICCTYGQGDWTMNLDGRVIFSGPKYSSNFGTQKDFQFDNKSSGKITITNEIGTFLIMPRPNDPVMCIELKDGFTNIPPTQERLIDQPYYGNEVRRGEGAIFELHNLPLDFDYDKLGLISGISQISLPTGSDAFLFGGIIDIKGKAPLVLSTDDRLKHNNVGEKTVLGIRVAAADASTTADEMTLYNSLFSNEVGTLSLASQMKACSFGKMTLVPFRSTQGIWGVYTIDLPSVSTAQGDAYMRNSITAALSSDILNADFIIYCLPPGTYVAARPGEGIAYAYINHWVSVFDDEWCHSSSLLSHEIGHNLNLGHSNQGGQPYEDQTGIMGASFPNKNGPRTCFNAAKSWQLGWYKDKGIRINSSGSASCFDGILHGIADYPIATTVLLKVQTALDDYYINFNAKKGINQGTQEAGNMVTVVSRPRGPRDSYAESDLVSKLNEGESYSFSGYSVNVETIDINAGTAEVKVLPTGQFSCPNS